MQVEFEEGAVRVPTASDVAALDYPTFEWPEEETVLKSVASIYKFVISCLVQQLRMWQLRWQANVVGALFWEPLKSIQMGMHLKEGKEKEFHLFGMNPAELTEQQLASRPILALHGKNGTQGTFISMAKAFQKASVGPLFTLNLCPGELTMEDRDRIDAKLQEIETLYGHPVQVDLIGYSRGAEMALYMGLRKDAWHIDQGGYCYQDKEWEVMRPTIGRIFRIGSMTTQEEWDQLPDSIRGNTYEIQGSEDIHMSEKSLASNTLEVYEGHVGLPDSPAVHQWIISILES